jgi:hypothetical protein
MLALLVPGRLLAAAPAPTPSDEFERGKTAFGRAEYKRAIEVLRPLLYPDVRLETEGEVVQAHRMLGVAHLFEDQPEEARRELRKLLELRPDYRFDPLLDPPRVVDFFNDVLRQEEREISAIEARRKKREAEEAARRARAAEAQRVREAVVVHVERHSLAVSLLPFGAGQFQNGQRRKGWLFLGAEAALGGASLAAFVTNFALYGIAPHRRCLVMQPLDANGLPQRCPDNEIDRSDERLSTDILRVQLVTGGLFFAVAAWGVIDAVRHFQREVPLDGETPPAAPSKGGLGLTLAPPPFSSTPFGLGAEWRF